eukprot:CAMPEP_0172545688 /NCGR_PEP_ID=MMETSP1067-20121228/15567_1 /TAXON_ID=265564 ORGANISM="Thalassiosira punctigera, Strain Tpunct2005C2" /NCGR_SAMPLE_ID=MMETSP1067 /ASSEMBLY_ACC=CAM_ASM_000444 /LENGTH=35 /DNA_ID= /DNA_START= /DNA_END= /DNA_ORIENTATION=
MALPPPIPSPHSRWCNDNPCRHATATAETAATATE